MPLRPAIPLAGLAGATVAGVFVLTAGCGAWGPEGGPGGFGAAAPDSAGSRGAAQEPVEATAGPDGVQRILVTLTDELTLVPSLVRAHPGVIEFTFHNDGVTPHSITIGGASPTPSGPPDAVGVAGTGNLNGDQASTVRVTITTPGRYPYPCLYHVTNGMRGTLDVTGPPPSGVASPERTAARPG